MRIAILGMGFMGTKHKAILNTFPNVEIVAEIDPENLDIQGSSDALDHFFAQKINCDLIVIATPNHLHFPQALRLLQNGYSILIEKPFCFSLREAGTLEEASIRNQCKVYVVAQNRYAPVAKVLKQIVGENRLGKLYNLQFNAFWNRDSKYYKPGSWKGKKDKDGGILYTQFSHLIDLLCFILEEDLHIQYKDLRTYRNVEITEIEDQAVVILRSASGTTIVLNFTTSVFEKNQETSLNIIGELGTLKISGQYFDEVQFQHIQGIQENYKIASQTNEENLKAMYHDIFNSLNGLDNQSISIEKGKPLIGLLEKIHA